MYTIEQIKDLLDMRHKGYYVKLTTRKGGVISSRVITRYKADLWAYEIPLARDVLSIDLILESDYKSILFNI